jgi:serine/threonine-protein kinase RsbW
MATDVLSIALRNQLSELGRLAGALEEFRVRHSLGPHLVNQVMLVLEEVLTNTISYGFPDAGEHTIRVDVCLANDQLTIRVEDDGRPFDITKVAAPDVTAPLDEREVGGLGILLVRKLMDEVTYARRGACNVLLLTKNRPAQQVRRHHA